MFLPTFMTSEHPGSLVFQQTRTIFIHIQNTIQTNILTKKNAPPPGGHVFQETGTIFNLSKISLGPIFCPRKMSRPLGGHVFPPTGTIFELIQDIILKNRLTKLNDDWTINVASRVLIRKNAPPLGSHAFKATKTIFELTQAIFGTHLLTKVHEDQKINVTSRVLTRNKSLLDSITPAKNAPPPCFSSTRIIFELVKDIIGMNLLTKFYEDRTINVASRVKNDPSLGSHVFQANITIFKLIQDIIETNHLTTFP
ncbi:hypothetical protein DPMN_131501 [Dreissena polymorpha]|uniref:Uncharacterized protein n=1 Tax=Dreissena polymorpha TaxID=45954 RepID=A0A9D4JYI8_DREPO|nr:hypothetical protein DPMN_131501 [Dreissena polymorpha]